MQNTRRNGPIRSYLREFIQHILCILFATDLFLLLSGTFLYNELNIEIPLQFEHFLLSSFICILVSLVIFYSSGIQPIFHILLNSSMSFYSFFRLH
jgi:hypothetical protein